jgi:hypothetical protein
MTAGMLMAPTTRKTAQAASDTYVTRSCSCGDAARCHKAPNGSRVCVMCWQQLSTSVYLAPLHRQQQLQPLNSLLVT